MANIFGILTAVVLLLAAFVAFKNKDAYANELSHRKNEETKLTASQARLETARTNLANEQKTRSDTEGEVAKLTTDEADQKKTNAGLKEQVDTKKQTVASNKENLDTIREKTSAIGEINQLAQKVKDLRTTIEELKQGIATNESKLANLNDENTRVETVVAGLKRETEMISRRESYFTRTRINSLYPSWGLVTLGAGSTSGVVAGSTLEVVRDGSPVAKLTVTAVESNTSAATIVPDSVAQDTVLMVGDEVLPSQKAATPAKPAAKPAATPATPEKTEGTETPAEVPSLESELGADPLAEPAATPAAEDKPATEEPATPTEPAPSEPATDVDPALGF